MRIIWQGSTGWCHSKNHAGNRMDKYVPQQGSAKINEPGGIGYPPGSLVRLEAAGSLLQGRKAKLAHPGYCRDKQRMKTRTVSAGAHSRAPLRNRPVFYREAEALAAFGDIPLPPVLTFPHPGARHPPPKPPPGPPLRVVPRIPPRAKIDMSVINGVHNLRRKERAG